MLKLIRGAGFVAALLAATLWLGTGCEDDGNGGGSFVGDWALWLNGTDLNGPPNFYYVHFRDDGSFFMSLNPDGSGQLGVGTYTVSDGLLVGPFSHPGVGDGRVEATLNDDGTMNYNFIEYWHTPNKVNPCTGKRL